MRLPMSKVESIDESDSILGEYRARSARLGKEREDAESWLELAQWARAHDFVPGVEKASQLAARLDPDLPGLAPLMKSIGWVRDDQARDWVPYADAMRRQGLVEDHGEWVTPTEKRERSQERVEAAADDPHSRADDHLDKALGILAAAVNRPETPTTVVVQQPGYPGYLGAGFGYGASFVGGFFGEPLLPDGSVAASPGPIYRDVSMSWDQLARRQPGSFIPMSPNNTGRPRLDPVTHRFNR
jgi:hypothetical protein